MSANPSDEILLAMTDVLSCAQMKRLREVLQAKLGDRAKEPKSNEDLLAAVTIDNIRRIFSSFFSWLEDEEYVVKSPVRRIHKVKAPEVVKKAISDEEMERLREACENERDLAIIDLFASTGMRVGEFVRLNISNLNLVERECLVTGKGNKLRKAYFDARTKLHIESYLETRTDDNPALFVGLGSRCNQLKVS